MRHDITIKTPGYENFSYEFAWDDEAGTVSGKDAPWVLDGVADSLRIGVIQVEGGTIPVTNPLKNKTEFAALYARFLGFPEELKRFYPTKDYSGYQPDITPADVIAPEYAVLY